MKRHILKLESLFWQSVVTGEKTAEVRLNDRDYQKGDIIIFQNIDHPEILSQEFIITHILNGGQFGIDKRYVVLSIKSY